MFCFQGEITFSLVTISTTGNSTSVLNMSVKTLYNAAGNKLYLVALVHIMQSAAVSMETGSMLVSDKKGGRE